MMYPHTIIPLNLMRTISLLATVMPSNYQISLIRIRKVQTFFLLFFSIFLQQASQSVYHNKPRGNLALFIIVSITSIYFISPYVLSSSLPLSFSISPHSVCSLSSFFSFFDLPFLCHFLISPSPHTSICEE